MRTRRHAPPHEHTVVTVGDVGTALGISRRKAQKVLKQYWYVTRHFRRADGLYDHRVIDLLHALLGQDSRPLGHGEADWLDRYLGGDTHAR